MFGWRDDDAGLVRAFTDRRDGVSAAPFAGLNLGAHVGDDPTAVARNRAALEAALGLPTVWADQVHGSEVIHVTPDVLTAPRTETGAVGTGDAMVTAEPGIALGVLVADCTPVLLLDRSEGLVAAVHAANTARPDTHDYGEAETREQRPDHRRGADEVRIGVQLFGDHGPFENTGRI